MEDYLEEKPIEADRLIADIRKATLDISMTPVLCGSAFKNKGVQPLLDAVIDYLPEPARRPAGRGPRGLQSRTATATRSSREASDDEPFAALAFKVMADPYVGKLTYFRVYSGKLSAGGRVLNSITGRTERVGRILMMHANSREEVEEVYAGDIAAGVGLKQTSTGDTLSAPDAPVVLEAITFPDPVVHLSIEPKTKVDQEKLSVALQRLGEEDPTFQVRTDEETGQTVISGMGELHLEVIVDRLKREFKVEAAVGRPAGRLPRDRARQRREGRGQVHPPDRRLGPVRRGLHRPRAGPGRGLRLRQQGQGRLRAVGVHPRRREGHRGGARVGRQGRLPDGGRARHAHRRQVPRHRLVGDRLQDRRLAGAQGGRAQRAKPVLLEPIMAVEVVTPQEFIGDVIGDLSRRRGRVEGQEPRGNAVAVKASVPLSAMFGYATDLRSSTQGRANYTMQFDRYEEVPQNIAEEIVEHRTGEPVGAREAP